jgi:hypothetical protein
MLFMGYDERKSCLEQPLSGAHGQAYKQFVSRAVQPKR